MISQVTHINQSDVLEPMFINTLYIYIYNYIYIYININICKYKYCCSEFCKKMKLF